MSIKMIDFKFAGAAALAFALFFTSACKQDAPVQQEKNDQTGFADNSRQKSSAPADNAASGAGERPAPGASPSLVDPVNSGGSVNPERGKFDPTWPNDLPGGISKPKGVVFANFDRTTVNGVETWNVYYTSANVADVRAYEAELKAAGYKTSLMAGDKAALLNAKKDNISIVFSMMDAEKKFMVQQRKK